VLLALLLFLVGFSLYTFSRLNEANRLNDQSHQILLDTQRCLTALVDGETGARGFAITGKDAFLGPYREGIKNFDSILTTLEQSAHNAERQADLKKLRGLHQEWVGRANAAIARRRKARSMTEVLRGVEQRAMARKVKMDTMRGILGKIVQSETAVLEERSERQQHLQQLTQITLWLGAIFSIAFTAVLGTLVVSATNKVKAFGATLAQANADLAESNAQLEAANMRMAETNIRLNEEVAERKRAENRLAESVEELRRSNMDLEQFAYVASHDLQEPLRAVGGCVQLLKLRYRDKLDERAEQLIDHAVDGAQRMQNLINDLLAYSRVGTHSPPPEPVNMEEVASDVLRVLAPAIAESSAMVTHDPLPRVLGNGGQLELVLQNLISNALKFKGNSAPLVHVGCRQAGPEYIFSVQDQGPGINPEYFERIFVMFQRLHTRTEFPGTGIGLAICKKIIERNGGRIWVESEPGVGATFFFTVPVLTTKGLDAET
jgi:signal transduction histidine kinase